ncbi:Hypothetical predicted protein [Lecanosticta acicola]|uniref:Uncharacterized protein n=1 Tax=Lecanosticta acicola TaxID=111012 RepID=A0AAI9E8V1_9PEZI|nr:Hypothetical predicted protein [Lecanosticta acicola]
MSAAIHSSLAILLSDVNNRETQRQNVHSAARTHPQATVAEQFRKGSANFINQAITASNLGAMVQMGNDHIAPNFYSRIDNYVPAHPFAEYVENLRRFKVEFPTSECGPLDADVEVDDKTRPRHCLPTARNHRSFVAAEKT